MSVDLHQHLWPELFLDALRARRSGPRIDGWELRLPGERSYAIDPADHDAAARAALARGRRRRARLRRARRRRSGSTGCRPRRPTELADAWLDGALALPRAVPRLGAGAASRSPTPPRCADALERGAIGLEVAADVLAAPGRARPPRAAARRARGARARPLLVHPGPAGGDDAPGRPGWWAPVVPYVAQLHAAWWAWADGGPRALSAAAASASPRSPGSARCTASATAPAAATARAVDPLTFVETSSLRHPGGRRRRSACSASTSSATARTAPTPTPAPPALGDAALHAIRTRNPERLLAHRPEEVPA